VILYFVDWRCPLSSCQTVCLKTSRKFNSQNETLPNCVFAIGNVSEWGSHIWEGASEKNTFFFVYFSSKKSPECFLWKVQISQFLRNVIEFWQRLAFESYVWLWLFLGKCIQIQTKSQAYFTAHSCRGVLWKLFELLCKTKTTKTTENSISDWASLCPLSKCGFISYSFLSPFFMKQWWDPHTRMLKSKLHCFYGKALNKAKGDILKEENKTSDIAPLITSHPKH